MESEIFEIFLSEREQNTVPETRSNIHFSVFVIVPEVFKLENSPKMVIFDLKCDIFDQK